MNIFGHNFRLAIWGESHGPQIGISIDGIPAAVRFGKIIPLL